MLFSSKLTGLIAYTSTVFAAVDVGNSTTPRNIGFVVFPSFQALDVFGPLDALNLLSWKTQLNLSIIAASLDPVSTKVRSAAMNPFNSTFGESIVPTHTFENAPPLDVLFIPGGVGTLAIDLNSTVAFVAETYPSLQYLVSVCTGARIAARAGILDGRNATTNKLAWNTVVNLGPRTSWRAHARWIVDGNVWTGAGVSAGIDTALAWMGAVWGEDVANSIALGMEYERHSNATWDPFSTYYNLTDVINGVQVQSSPQG